MKKIIDGKVYDTNTATEVCDITPSTASEFVSDFSYEDTRLYRTPKGSFFISGEGGATSRWAQAVGDGRTGGSGLVLVDEDEARALVETHASPEVYIKVFGEPVEG